MKRGTLLLIAAVALTGCATKRYPMATPLGASERAAMSCHDLALEISRGEEVRRQIADTAQVDWRSAAGFLGDWGIGNAMAKSEADKAVETRMAQLREAQAAKGCNGGPGGMMKFLSDLFR